ncbi:MAG: nuclease-related domain-containing protein [Flavobacterium sp.]
MKKKNEIENDEAEKIEKKISELNNELNKSNIQNSNFFKRIFTNYKIQFINREINFLIKNKAKLISSSVNELSLKISSEQLFIKKYETNKQQVIQNRANPQIKKLEYTRSVLENLKNLISGAIGENLVVKEIEKLSDDYVLVNDFNLCFEPPIFYKKYNQRIYSIQIDHLLISRAGIFIIETKNWSQTSLNSINLRSPVEQIERSNFALNIYISENLSFNEHHWGEQRIPIRNLIVLINNKPKIEFKYVKIKLLNELLDYINYFNPILTDIQFNKIVNKLVR